MIQNFLKISGGILTALILWISLSKNGKDISTLLTLVVCSMVLISAMTFFRPILTFMENVRDLGNIDSEYIAIILKVVGIGLITEICMLICKDAGNESLGKALQITASFVVLWISIPVLEKLLELIDTILGAV